MTHNSSVILWFKHYILWSKRAIKVQVLRLSNVRSKFTKFLMPFFKAQASSFSNFASCFSVMSHNSSVCFWLKHICSPGTDVLCVSCFLNKSYALPVPCTVYSQGGQFLLVCPRTTNTCSPSDTKILLKDFNVS